LRGLVEGDTRLGLGQLRGPLRQGPGRGRRLGCALGLVRRVAGGGEGAAVVLLGHLAVRVLDRGLGLVQPCRRVLLRAGPAGELDLLLGGRDLLVRGLLARAESEADDEGERTAHGRGADATRGPPEVSTRLPASARAPARGARAPRPGRWIPPGAPRLRAGARDRPAALPRLP